MCEFCDNAIVQSNVDLDNDLSYTKEGISKFKLLTSNNDLSYKSIGCTDQDHNMLIRSGGGKPTEIIVQQWNDMFQCNEIVGVYKMKYCSECGRKLIENIDNNPTLDWLN